MANSTVAKASSRIPQDVQQDMIAVALLTARLHEIQSAIEHRQSRIVEKLTGVNIDAGVLGELVAAHNRRAKLAQRAVPA